jgi:peptide/nickel transport system substrate-binding protein
MNNFMNTFKRISPCLATLTVVLGLSAPAALAADKVIKAVMESNLASLDPIVSTATSTSIHASMIYDTLFAWDANMVAQPQMVQSYKISNDKLTYTFVLRPGQKWHDGAPVTAQDCVASIRRWGAKDRAGQQLLANTASLSATDEKTIQLVLREPWGQVLDALGKVGSNYPAMMPKRVAELDPSTQLTDTTGSGPFKFVKEQWVPGSKAVYVKNMDYQPRAEPPSGMAGGRVVKVDRVEWQYMPDPQTATSALIAGEVDLIQTPPVDFLPTLKASPGVKIESLASYGLQGIVRLNHLQPPFNQAKMRQGMLYLVSQADLLEATIGVKDYYKPCTSMYGCSSRMSTKAGGEPLETPNIEKAKALFAEAGYKGQPIVILDPTERQEVHGPVLALAQAARKAGLNVEAQAVDWGTLMNRRAKKGPPAEGGWNIFVTSQTVLTASNPMNNLGLAANCDKAWPGWPCDEEAEKLRTSWAKATGEAERKSIAEKLQKRAFEVVTYIPYGEWNQPVAYRGDRLEGFVKVPINLVFWNVTKK